MPNGRARHRGHRAALAAIGVTLALGACAGRGSPDAAADKADSTGGALGTGLGTLAPGKGETTSPDGAFAPPPDPAAKP